MRLKRRFPKPYVKTIGILSGKGGAGKSTVTALLACHLSQRYKVSVLDADLSGSSLPTMFNCHQKIVSDGKTMYPAKISDNLALFSFGLMTQKPLIWRGPILTKAVLQILEEVEWPETEVFLVDFPPGTGDINITLMQRVKFDTLFFVGAPSRVVVEVVRKSQSMAKQFGIENFHYVENMSYLICPHCGKRIELFPGAPQTEAAAHIPFEPALAKAAAEGKICEGITPAVRRELEKMAALTGL